MDIYFRPNEFVENKVTDVLVYVTLNEKNPYTFTIPIQ